MGQQVLPTISGEVRLETAGLTKDAAAIIAMQERMAASGVDAYARVGAAAAKAGDVTTASNRAAESSGERWVASLIRQAEQVGKTASQIRAMKVEQAASRAETKGLTELADRLRASLANLEQAEMATGTAHTTSAKAATGNGFALRNLSFQVNDVVTGLASGQKPLQVLAQQGGQIFQIFQTAEGGFKGFARSVIAAMAPFAAVLVPVGVAAAGLFGAFKLFQAQVKSDGDLTRYRDSLGLTHAEMLKLSDGVDKAGDKITRLSTVSVTAGDVLTGLWKTIADGAGTSAVGGVFDKIGGMAVTAFHKVLDAWQAASAGITAGIYGTFDAVRTVWSTFPAVFGDLFVSGVNVAIGALNKLVKLGVDQLNTVIGLANKLPGVNVGTMAAPQIAPIDNANAGAAAKAAQAIGAGYTKAYADARKADAAFWKQVGDNSRKHAMDRMKEEADALKADRTPKKPKDAKRAETLARDAAAIEAQTRNLYKLADAYGQSGAAALIAEAREKAESEAIRKRGDVEAFVARQVQLAIAQRVADAAKATASLTNQAAVQARVNDQVAAGLVPASEAGRLVKEQMDDLPLLAAVQAAQQLGLTVAAGKAIKALEAQRKARADLTAEEKRAQDLAQADQIKKRIDLTQQEGVVAEAAGRKRLDALKGLSGQPLEDALAAINAEQEKSNILLRAQAEAAELVKKGMTDAAAATLAQADAAAKAVDRDAAQRKAEQDIERRKQQFLEIGQQFADIVGGGLGKAVSAVLPLLDKAMAAFSGTSTLAKLGAGAGLGGAAAGATGGSALLGGIGGAIGSSKAVTSLVSKGLTAISKDLGQFAGPVASIGVGLLTSVIGGLFKKVKSASATVEIMGGSAVQSALAGNSDKLKGVASTLATSLIGSLSGIADQLGGLLGNNLKVSIGQRKDTFRVDLSGQGRTKNMPSFKTQDEAVAYAVQSLIQQGAITGLKAGTETLLKGKGDLQAQLQKALSFEGVFDQLKQRTDPVGYAMDQVAKEFDNLNKVFAEAGASADDYAKLQQLRALKEADAQAQAKQDDSERLGLERQLADAQGDTAATRQMDLDALLPANRELQRHVWALQDEADAAAKAADLAKQRRDLEIEVMQASGDAVGALAAQREDELAALDPTLRSLKAQVYALTDAKEATDKATAAAEAAAQAEEALANTRAGLEDQLLQLQGDMAGQRERELAALDPSLRGLKQMIYALTDQQAAAQAAAQAADAAAQAEQQLASQRENLEGQILTLQGNTAETRRRELAALDPSLRALQAQVYALTDLKEAQDAATAAAETAAQAEQAIAQERQGLMQQLWQLTGDTASIRAAALAQLDPSNRLLQQQVWAVQDAQDAAKAAADLSSAWKGVGDSITDEVKRIRGLTDAQAGGSFATLQGQFNAAVSAARAGDQDAAKGLPDLSKALLDQAAKVATSQQELTRVQAATAAALEGVADRIGSAAYASDQSTAGLTGGATTASADAASWWARFAGGAEAPARIAANDTRQDDGGDQAEALRSELADLRGDIMAALHAVASNTGDLVAVFDRLLRKGGGNALPVVIDDDAEEAA